MKMPWTMAAASAVALLAMQQGASAETKPIDCAAVPYEVTMDAAWRGHPKCSVQHVTEAGRTYAVYRETEFVSKKFVKFVVLYKASKGGFGIRFDLDDEAQVARQKSAVAGTDGAAWAFEGLLDRRPKEADIAYPPGLPVRFEAHVKALGGKLAYCFPTSKYSERGSASADTVYAIGLACTPKGDSEGDELSVTNTLWYVEWEGRK